LSGSVAAEVIPTTIRVVCITNRTKATVTKVKQKLDGCAEC
jgi:hypothetical protein